MPIYTVVKTNGNTVAATDISVAATVLSDGRTQIMFLTPESYTFTPTQNLKADVLVVGGGW
jgi:hypothetical protein